MVDCQANGIACMRSLSSEELTAMRRSTLVLMLVGAVDTFLLGLMVYLIHNIREGTMHTAIEQGEAVNRIALTLGGTAGALSVLGLLAFAALRFMKH
jgi:hypothetical protein